MAERRRKKSSREQDLTGRYFAGDFDQADGDDVARTQKYSNRSKTAEQDKILRTAAMRAAAEQASGDAVMSSLRVGRVVQIHSLFSEVEHETVTYLCVARKTLQKVAATAMVVGDRVRIRESGTKDDLGRPEAVIEQILPRDTVVTRTDSFKTREQHPVVANADQMLIVASLLHPQVKWGLIDRMMIAAQSGKVKPIICLNKTDLAAAAGDEGKLQLKAAREVLDYYEWLGVPTLQTSIETGAGLDELKTLLKDRSTVLAGHSGVGKSSLINSIQPTLDIRTGEVSDYTAKGRHTTTSARRYKLDFGGEVIDTPGVKMFGLWGVTRETLKKDYYRDVATGAAPPWRVESYQRIAESLSG